jgi:hypothetical protein
VRRASDRLQPFPFLLEPEAILLGLVRRQQGRFRRADGSRLITMARWRMARTGSFGVHDRDEDRFVFGATVLEGRIEIERRAVCV